MSGTTGRATYVVVDGPHSGGIDRRGNDELPEWSVTLCDDNDTELRTYQCLSFHRAVALGEQIARDRHIELVNEASRA